MTLNLKTELQLRIITRKKSSNYSNQKYQCLNYFHHHHHHFHYHYRCLFMVQCFKSIFKLFINSFLFVFPHYQASVIAWVEIEDFLIVAVLLNLVGHFLVFLLWYIVVISFIASSYSLDSKSGPVKVMVKRDFKQVVFHLSSGMSFHTFYYAVTLL